MDDTGKCLMFNVRDNVWRCSESSTLAALAGLESQTFPLALFTCGELSSRSDCLFCLLFTRARRI